MSEKNKRRYTRPGLSCWCLRSDNMPFQQAKRSKRYEMRPLNDERIKLVYAPSAITQIYHIIELKRETFLFPVHWGVLNNLKLPKVQVWRQKSLLTQPGVKSSNQGKSDSPTCCALTTPLHEVGHVWYSSNLPEHDADRVERIPSVYSTISISENYGCLKM